MLTRRQLLCIRWLICNGREASLHAVPSGGLLPSGSPFGNAFRAQSSANNSHPRMLVLRLWSMRAPLNSNSHKTSRY